MGYQCFHCLQDTVCWDSDFDFADYGLDGEGIIHVCHCTNCGAEIEYRISCENKDDEKSDTAESEDESHTYKFCLRCGKQLKSEESRMRGYGKICERKALVENKMNLF